MLATRYQWRCYVRRQRERGVLALRTLIVGANAEAGRVATEMRRSDLGFVPLGYVCADGWGRPTTDIPMLGHIDDLSELIRQTDADCLFVAASAIHPEHMVQVSKTARRDGRGGADHRERPGDPVHAGWRPSRWAASWRSRSSR